MASIARKNLFEDIPRFLVAQAGIMFAVSLVTIQTGILNGFTRSTGRLIDQSSADIWVSSREILHSEVSLPIPLERVQQARQVAGVERAEALFSRSALWRSPNDMIVPIRIYGFDPNGQLFGNWQLKQGDRADLRTPYSVWAERSNLNSLDFRQIGDVGSISSLPAKLVGITEDTQSMASSAYIFTSLESANAYVNSGLTSRLTCRSGPNQPVECLNTFETAPTSSGAPPAPKPLSASDPTTFVLVKANSGENLDALKRRLEAALPGTRALTKDEIGSMTRDYWQRRTGIGFVLGLGAAVGIVVGMVVVSQILYSSVSDHIREYGTLKAMGASDWVIYRVITEQALWMAVLGYIPSMALCWGLGSWTIAAKGIMILITPATAVTVFGITIVMCVGSAVFAIQRVTHVDPAIVFKA
ncbi:ABC transporter permease [Leptolyngbya sp. FACHB-36]|uniref:FtsX-like permease family protein n=1 Tax=Leptolyngbya sp. FACHB-36 TaxID=2692808 RepID=UPI001681067A|nr:FtsX-like permease family protein [Leptolyngbya sp. FACHB-36]MBD2022232.1 ABC transporter permease [Leptolyngbya sp. FACHB-36]